MFLREILSYWNKSLGFFKLDNLKLFFFAALNNTKRSLNIFAKKFGWFFLTVFIFLIGVLVLILSKNCNFLQNIFLRQNQIPLIFFSLNFFILLLLMSVFLFIVHLIVRPSIESKDYFYFKIHIVKFGGFFLLFFFMPLFSNILVNIFRIDYNPLFFVFFSSIVTTIFSFAIFFFLDEQGGIKSIFFSLGRSFKVLVYFLPVFLFLNLFYAFFHLIKYFFGYILTVLAIRYGLPISFWFFLFFILIILTVLFFTLSLIVNYYTMLKHKYHKLFYN